MSRTTLTRLLVFTLSAVMLQFASIASFAADDNAGEDPPERVARLSYLKGTVNFHSEDERNWLEASINRPLTSGDQLKLERNARAELQTWDPLESTCRHASLSIL